MNRQPATLRLLAPAKINLHLRVGPPTPDGFHPLLSWMCTVALFDTIVLSRGTAQPSRVAELPNASALHESWAVELSCDDPSVPCDARLRAVLHDAIGAEGFPARDLASGAGHDAAALAAICPVAMLFLRCEGGISHNPAENVDGLDVAIALDVMERALLDLGARP